MDEELLYTVYYYPMVDWDKDEWENQYSVNVYDRQNIYHYVADRSLTNLHPSDAPQGHYFDAVPWSIFYLTDDGESIFKCVIGLQDAYNKMLSDSVNDWEAFVDAYMVLTDIDATSEDIASMKENRILLLDDGATASYLTKSTSDTQVQNLLDEMNTAIHTIANSPDFSSEEFGAGVSSGIALQFKLVGFNNIAANIETNFRKAIQDRTDLLNQVFTLLDLDTYDVDVVFTHNLPTNIADTADTINKLRGLVSNRTLLAQIPFIDDADEELEQIEKESEVSDLYDFTDHGTGQITDPNLEGD